MFSFLAAVYKKLVGVNKKEVFEPVFTPQAVYDIFILLSLFPNFNNVTL